jgi:cullin-4
VAKHIDAAMRGGARAGAGAAAAAGEDDLEASVDAALALFRLIQGKDVFEAFYKKDLAKRLLLGRSTSVDAEKAAISKLKAECGPQFTSKLEGMFKDVELSRDVMASFRQAPAAGAALARLAPGMDLSVQVLTSGFWPSYPALECTLPAELSAAQQVFKDFYLSKHSGRKLVWCNSLGTCIMRAAFDAGAKELSVSLFQVRAAWTREKLNGVVAPACSSAHPCPHCAPRRRRCSCCSTTMRPWRLTTSERPPVWRRRSSSARCSRWPAAEKGGR